MNKNNNIIDQAGLSGYAGSSGNGFGSSTGFHTSYAAAEASEQSSAATIQTNSSQQTNEYLSRTETNLFNDPNPQIVRRAATEAPVTYQQKILVRFLQPPPIPPPGVIERIFRHQTDECFALILAIDHQRGASTTTTSTATACCSSTCTTTSNTTTIDFT